MVNINVLFVQRYILNVMQKGQMKGSPPPARRLGAGLGR